MALRESHVQSHLHLIFVFHRDLLPLKEDLFFIDLLVVVASALHVLHLQLHLFLLEDCSGEDINDFIGSGDIFIIKRFTQAGNHLVFTYALIFNVCVRFASQHLDLIELRHGFAELFHATLEFFLKAVAHVTYFEAEILHDTVHL